MQLDPATGWFQGIPHCPSPNFNARPGGEISLLVVHNIGAGTRVEDLSLRTISDDASPVVKLVNSTLYDALRLGVDAGAPAQGAPAVCFLGRPRRKP